MTDTNEPIERKKKVGRPRLNLTDEEKKERKKKAYIVYNRTYYETKIKPKAKPKLCPKCKQIYH